MVFTLISHDLHLIPSLFFYTVFDLIKHFIYITIVK